MHRIAIFASGDGSNFEALTLACCDGRIADAKVVLCVCDRKGAGVVGRAARLGVETFVFSAKDYGSKEEYEREIGELLDSKRVDLVCLAGYMRIIGPTLLSAYGGRMINIHPSLLPAFDGANAIADALAYGVKVYGATIHRVNEVLDGGEIIAQRAFGYEGSSLEELEELMHRTEHEMYIETVEKLLNNK